MALFDYDDRPSKAVARRIFVDSLRRLRAFQALDSYSYVGFGSIQFIDFELVHRSLGITKMTSIEADSSLLQRCYFNVPFKGIEIFEGTSATVLPTLDWSSRAIVNLDYTQRLRQDELGDCENLALLLVPGSVLAVTLNCQPNSQVEQRRSDLEDAVGARHVPLGVTGAKLGGWGLADVQRDILTSVIQGALASRGDGSSWKQVLNINYKDGASMQMIVGVIDHPDIHESLTACRFQDMPEVRDGAGALAIQIPVLTTREKQALNSKLPGAVRSFAGISESDLKAYAAMYRWMDRTG